MIFLLQIGVAEPESQRHLSSNVSNSQTNDSNLWRVGRMQWFKHEECMLSPGLFSAYKERNNTKSQECQLKKAFGACR
jgi:hypothetical protein